MNRTHALFGLAASLVVGAVVIELLWTDPTTAPPPPIVEPAEPAPTAQQPVPRIGFGDLVRLDAALSNGFVTPGGAGDLLMRVTLDAADVAATVRPPMALAIVFDRSGSMETDGKMDRAREAAHRVVDRLSDADQLAIVSYASDHEVNLALAPVGQLGRARIRRVIDELYLGGGTNLSSGLDAGIAEVERARGSGTLRRVVLMSDGNANQGETDPDVLAETARHARRRGVTVTSVGVGVDFNEDLMTGLAEAGGGAYHYARGGEAIATALERELDGMVRLAARGVEVSLGLPAGVTLKDAPGYRVETRNGRLVIPVGDMAAGEHRQIIARLAVRPSGEGFVPVADLGLDFVPAASQTQRSFSGHLSVIATADARQIDANLDTTVLEAAEAAQAAEARQRAAEQFGSGDRAAATGQLERQLRKTREAARRYKSARLEAQVREMESTMQAIDGAEVDSDSGKDLVKREKLRARSILVY
jgi:Ca-activated chloride channel family protein